MELNNIKQVYLIGIGGIGMSGLARYFKKRGCIVCGYDKTPTVLTDNLVLEDIQISFVDEVETIPASFGNNEEGTLVIYTPAIPATSKVFNHFKNGGFTLQKRSQVLGIISRGMFTIAVGGTHGKTTTSSIIAHVLKDSGYDCSAFLGGIASNYNTNVLFGTNNTVVVEADEYDRSFLTLHPDIAVITSMDADHLDIYGHKDQLTESFMLFASQIKAGGKLINRNGLPLNNGFTYAANEDCAIQAYDIHVKQGEFYFNFKNGETTIENVQLSLPGLHNIENAIAAIEVALHLGIAAGKIKSALANFKGVKRRFEYIVKTANHIYIDDYAHHPEELRACITAVKTLYPDKNLTTIFQPHLFTRTRDFAEGFSEVLSMTDNLILLDIYPARELPIEGVNSEMILKNVSISNKQKLDMEQAKEYVKNTKPELLLTVGAGDIDMMVKPLQKLLQDVEEN